MNRPYYICYMIMSLDGRIDCPMTEHLKGTDYYYPILDSLNVPTRISGRVTAEIEMAKKGKFVPVKNEKLGKTAFKINKMAKGYDVIIDTKGTLLWEKGSIDESPLLIIASSEVSKEYLDYLDSLNISWIATGDKRVDFESASKIMYEEFKIERAAIVGGGHINAAFLDKKLIDEIIMVIGSGIDGRKGEVSVFDGLSHDKPLTQLKLLSVESLNDEAILAKYKPLY